LIYREYGKTGKKISVIGFGGMRFIKEEYQKGNYDKSGAIIKTAYDRGINYFDTAPDYCNENSEKIFGHAFKTMDRDKFFVSTKCGLWNAKNSNGSRKIIERSLSRLGVDKIDFFHLWAIKTLDEYKEFLKKGGIYEGALKAQKEGLIDHICISTHLSGEDIAQIANDQTFEGVTLGYNAVNFAYRQKGIDACHKAGLGIVTMNPLGGGIIPAHPNYFSFLKEGEDSLVVSALKFIIRQNKATSAIVGFSSIEEVEEAVLAGEGPLTADEDLLEKMALNLKEELNTLCTTCGYCDSCPEGIPIPMLLDSYNMRILTNGDDKQMFRRMDVHWEVDPIWASKCSACGQCELLCTQKLPIIERLAYIADAYENKVR